MSLSDGRSGFFGKTHRNPRPRPSRVLQTHWFAWSHRLPFCPDQSLKSTQKKLRGEVRFPVDDLMYLPGHPDQPYLAAAVQRHKGNTLTTGHYTALVRKNSVRGSDWLLYNDSSVTTIESAAVSDENAYVVVYRRLDSRDADIFNADTPHTRSSTGGGRSGGNKTPPPPPVAPIVTPQSETEWVTLGEPERDVAKQQRLANPGPRNRARHLANGGGDGGRGRGGRSLWPSPKLLTSLIVAAGLITFARPSERASV